MGISEGEILTYRAAMPLATMTAYALATGRAFFPRRVMVIEIVIYLLWEN
jgi:hypothetical protein